MKLQHLCQSMYSEGLEEELGKILMMMRIVGGHHINVSSMSNDIGECELCEFHMGVGRKGDT
jgi:hypothetical protein